MGAAGAAGAFAPDAPTPLNYGQITADTLLAQEQQQLGIGPFAGMGRLIDVEGPINREYNAQSLRNLRETLLGTAGGTREEQYTDYVATPASNLTFAEAAQQGLVERVGGSYLAPQWGLTDKGRQEGYLMPSWGGTGITRPAFNAATPRTRTVTEAASPGLLALLGETMPEIDALTSASQRRPREGEMADISTLGPGYLKALRSINPAQTGLLDRLTADAQSDLDSTYNPAEIRALTQGYRAAAGGLLADTGNAGAAAESFYMANNAYNRRRQNQDYARQIIGLHQALYGDPFLQITGRASGSLPAAGGALGQAAGVNADNGFSGFNPESSFAGSLANANFNAANAAEIAGANSRAGSVSGLMSMFGSLGGSYLSGKKK